MSTQIYKVYNFLLFDELIGLIIAIFYKLKSFPDKVTIDFEVIFVRKIWLYLAALLAAVMLSLPIAAETINNQPELPTTIFGKDDREPVANPQQSPNNAVCRLKITYRDGSIGYGTGFIYGKNLLATAAHCLYDASRGGKADNITVYPAASEKELPFGEYMVDAGNSVFHYPKKWRENGDWKYDFGVIETEQVWDERIKPLKLENRSVSQLKSGTFLLVGYDYKSFTQYRSIGKISQVRSNDLLYRLDVLHGESGAPVMDQNGVVVGIANYGAEAGGSNYNSAARINHSVYQFLTSYLKKR